MFLEDYNFDGEISVKFEPCLETVTKINEMGFCGLYESMHTFGSGDFITRILNEFEEIIKKTKLTNGVIMINGDNFANCGRGKINMDNISVQVDSKHLNPIHTGNRHILAMNVSAIIFVANNESDIKQMVDKTFDNPHKFPIMSCYPDTILIYRLGYIKGKFVLFETSGNKISIIKNTTPEEALYHEFMHKYTNIASDYRIFGTTDNPMNKDTGDIYGKLKAKKSLAPDEQFLLDFCYIVYALHSEESASFVAQIEPRFRNAGIKSKKDFYELLDTSKPAELISKANDIIRVFHKMYLNDIPISNPDITTVIKDYLNPKHDNASESSLILKTIKKLQRDISRFKHNLYNAAYNSVPDEMKSKLNEDYFKTKLTE